VAQWPTACGTKAFRKFEVYGRAAGQ